MNTCHTLFQLTSPSHGSVSKVLCKHPKAIEKVTFLSPDPWELERCALRRRLGEDWRSRKSYFFGPGPLGARALRVARKAEGEGLEK